METKPYYTDQTLNLRGELLSLRQPLVMGILNATPDSFYAGSRIGVKEVVSRAGQMLSEGAELLDVGGYSTRPGAEEVSSAEELDRVLPVVEAIVEAYPHARISVDTFRSSVARAAVEAGCVMVNDVSGGQLDEAMFDTVAELRVPYVLMHSRGNPKTMQQLTQYDHLLFELLDFLAERVRSLRQKGCTDVVIDPGFGFAKTRAQNFYLLRNLQEFRLLGCPILAGLSRKSMIWKTLSSSPEASLNGTTALNMLALSNGASILRVHDVAPAIEAVQLFSHYARHDDSEA